MKLAIIGYGSMGSMILKKVIENNFLPQREIIVKTSSAEKEKQIKNNYHDVTTTNDNTIAVQAASTIIFCGTNRQIKDVLRHIKPILSTDKHFISIAGCVTIGDIKAIIECQVSKVIPTVISEVNEGVSLTCHHKDVSLDNKAFVENLFSSFSTVKIIEEKDFELSTDLTSCAPGLFSAIFAEFIQSALRHGTLQEFDVNELVIKTAYGFSKLAIESHMSYEEMIGRVATKGGITEEGVKVLKNGLPGVFDEMFRVTLAKHDTVKEMINKL